MCGGPACLVGEFLESSRLSLRGAQLLGLATSPAAAETVGRGVGDESLGGREGRPWQEEGSRGPWTPHRASVSCLSPCVGGGRKPSAQKDELDWGLQVKQVVTGEQEAFQKVVGLRRGP